MSCYDLSFCVRFPLVRDCYDKFSFLWEFLLTCWISRSKNYTFYFYWRLLFCLLLRFAYFVTFQLNSFNSALFPCTLPCLPVSHWHISPSYHLQETVWTSVPEDRSTSTPQNRRSLPCHCRIELLWPNLLHNIMHYTVL